MRISDWSSDVCSSDLIKAIGTVKGIAVDARAADLLPAIIDAVIETDHQIGSGRICRADVALLRPFIGNAIGILGTFKAAAELRIISHHGEALHLGGRRLLEARYEIGGESCGE